MIVKISGNVRVCIEHEEFDYWSSPRALTAHPDKYDMGLDFELYDLIDAELQKVPGLQEVARVDRETSDILSMFVHSWVDIEADSGAPLRREACVGECVTKAIKRHQKKYLT